MSVCHKLLIVRCQETRRAGVYAVQTEAADLLYAGYCMPDDAPPYTAPQCCTSDRPALERHLLVARPCRPVSEAPSAERVAALGLTPAEVRGSYAVCQSPAALDGCDLLYGTRPIGPFRHQSLVMTWEGDEQQYMPITSADFADGKTARTLLYAEPRDEPSHEADLIGVGFHSD